MIVYRKIVKYKYELMKDYDVMTPIKNVNADDHFIQLQSSGKIIIKKGYCWDGPSGPSIDTKSFMRGSLVHDAFYQLMRAGKLTLSNRARVDYLIKDHCIEDGMYHWRAWYVERVLAWFGRSSAKPQNNEPVIETAP